MKLTQHIRDAFVRRALDDVPTIDHTEMIRRLVVEDAASRLPPAVKKVWADKATRDYIQVACVHCGGVSVAVPAIDRYVYSKEDFVLGETAKHAVERLQVEHDSSRKTREDLRKQLRSVALSVTTRKALAEALPEFAKYLPEDDAAALRSVPAIANVVAGFVAAGWPKDKVVPAKKAAKA